MRKHDMIRLRHMLDAAREALGFAQGRSRPYLDHDRMLVLSLVKDIEIIGEAGYQIQISDVTRDQLPAIPWPDIVAMRHRLVHAYFDLNLDVLWQTVQEDLRRSSPSWNRSWLTSDADNPPSTAPRPSPACIGNIKCNLRATEPS